MANEHPIFEYAQTELTAYKQRGVPLTDNWMWSMYEHIRRSFLYKHSKFSEGENDDTRPFKNIVLPILRVAYRAEGFDVKDVVPYVNDESKYDESFFVKKYHDKWAFDKSLDTQIDASTESRVDYGLTLAKKVPGQMVEIVPLERIGFCDQTNIMSGPICEVHPLAPDELMEQKWDAKAKQLALARMKMGKMITLSMGKQEAKTPGKYCQTFEIRGMFPETWLNDYAEDGMIDTGEYTDDTKYTRQLHIIGFYKGDKDEQYGMHFFKGPAKQVYKAQKRTGVFGRACGFGGVEELFPAQQFTNMGEIQQQEMLEFAAMVILQTADEDFKTKNVLTDKEKGEILIHGENKPISKVDTGTPNVELFKSKVADWNATAQALGSASEVVLGQQPPAGTPFSLQALVVKQAFGWHDYQKSQLSVFWAEIYRDWILPFLVADMKKGHKWLSDLSLEELTALADNIVELQTADMMKKFLMKGLLPQPAQVATYKQQVRDAFMKGGGKKFIKLVEGEMDNIPVDVMIDVAGQQFDLQHKADALTNIFRQVMQNPQILQMPGMGKLFNEIIEAAGFSPIDYAAITTPAPAPAPAPAAGNTGAPVPSNVVPQPISQPT